MNDKEIILKIGDWIKKELVSGYIINQGWIEVIMEPSLNIIAPRRGDVIERSVPKYLFRFTYTNKNNIPVFEYLPD